MHVEFSAASRPWRVCGSPVPSPRRQGCFSPATGIAMPIVCEFGAGRLRGSIGRAASWIAAAAGSIPTRPQPYPPTSHHASCRSNGRLFPGEGCRAPRRGRRPRGQCARRRGENGRALGRIDHVETERPHGETPSGAIMMLGRADGPNPPPRIHPSTITQAPPKPKAAGQTTRDPARIGRWRAAHRTTTLRPPTRSRTRQRRGQARGPRTLDPEPRSSCRRPARRAEPDRHHAGPCPCPRLGSRTPGRPDPEGERDDPAISGTHRCRPSLTRRPRRRGCGRQAPAAAPRPAPPPDAASGARSAGPPMARGR